MKKREIFQDHLQLARRLQRMARASMKSNPTDEQKKVTSDLQIQADEHKRKAALFGDRFIQIL